MDARGTWARSCDCLSDLPTELQVTIFGKLDPVSIVAVSQVNRPLRNSIDPGEEDYVNSLLALEITPKYGGDALIGVNFEPHRWVCTTCRRLRPHEWFDNPSLSNLGYVKPGIGTPAAEPRPWAPARIREKAPEDALFTDDKTKRKLKIYNGIFKINMGNISAEHPYTQHFELSQVRALGIPEVNILAQQPLNRDSPQRIRQRLREECFALYAELRGHKRMFRTCIECQAKLCRISSEACGLSMPPYALMVESRAMPFDSPLDRFFPEVATWPSQGQTPWPEYLGPNGANTRKALEPPEEWPMTKWPLRLIRCPQCETWQEQRAFRLCDERMAYDLPKQALAEDILKGTKRHIGLSLLLKEGVLCNHCLCKEKGVEALEAELVANFRDLLAEETMLVRKEVYRHWVRLLLWTLEENRALWYSLYDLADPKIPRIYEARWQDHVDVDGLKDVTATSFYQFAIATTLLMQSPPWIESVMFPFVRWMVASRVFIERWLWAEGVLARIDEGKVSLAEMVLARHGPGLNLNCPWRWKRWMQSR
ncbi:unnamed protein product [Clonostachys rosea]|uniref:F-box domain-containing protein n=1 Tax=Bionectria ochroleuca TaxID=29856 RepID=A0ABY6UMG2_BIOOC|nr:unnamed protein product [Clonostachys rosea]